MRIAGVIILIVSSTLAAAQHSILSKFIASPLNDWVYLEWTIKGGNTCNGIKVYRAEHLDSTFTQIGEIVGVCGNNAQPESYSFVDSFPITNQLNYYALELGFQGRTSTIQINLKGADELISIAYNENLQPLLIANPRIIGSSFSLIGINGHQVGEYEINDNEISLSRYGLENGIYLLVFNSEVRKQVLKFYLR
ncbi:MAG: hypothetical protein KDC92_06935 [Bacteroidetes bacterium]|nr:hypothetical protein [Bacteroidota bacterium]